MNEETIGIRVNIVNLFYELNEMNPTEAKELANWIKYELETGDE